MKLFITGGTGFIGSHFLNEAIAAKHKIIALRRSPSSKPKILISRNDKINWLDKSMFEVAAKDFKGCHAVIHLAAHSANVPYDTLENCIYWNVLAPLALFRKAIEGGVKRFIVAGSCFEYGLSAMKYKFIPTDAALEPTQSYPASKAVASLIFKQLAQDNNLQLSIHRIFQVYGEGEASSRLWPALRKAAQEGRDFLMTKGDQVRDFVYVKKVTKHFLNALNQKSIKPGKPVVLNVGGGDVLSMREFAKIWWQKWRAKGKIKFGELPYRRGEIMRLVAK